MESTVPRSRSSRSSYNSRRRRTHSEVQNNRISKIIKQVIICVAIFVIIFTIKNVDSSITNYLSIQTAKVLKEDSDISKIVSSAKQLFASLNISNEKLKAVFGSHAPNIDMNLVNDSNISEQMKDKVYDWTNLKDRGFENPISGVITSAFGNRISPITKESEFHEGIDISPVGLDEIKSVLDGTVIEVGSNASMGNFLKIKHNDITSVYAHANKILVSQEQQVKKGDVIAMAGDTGSAIGKHLHFELWKDSLMINPQGLFTLKTQIENEK